MLFLKICLVTTMPNKTMSNKNFTLIQLKQFRTKALYLVTYKTTTLFVLFYTKLLFQPTKRNNFLCTKMLIPMKYCILCIKRSSPNFTPNI